MQDGARIVIGGGKVSFAGDIKNLRLSGTTGSQNVMLRDLVGSEWINDDGVSHEGIIQGDVRVILTIFLAWISCSWPQLTIPETQFYIILISP